MANRSLIESADRHGWIPAARPSLSKTVFILTNEPPEGGGGQEHFVRELLRGLKERGYHTEVFHRGNSEPRWLERQGGPFGRKLAATLRGYWIGRNARRQMNPDVVAVISNSDVGWYSPRGRPSLRRVHFYHGTYRGQAEAIRSFIKYTGYLYLKWWGSMVLERLSGQDKLVFCDSDQVCTEVQRFFRWDSTAIWYPIDVERFSPGDKRASRAALNLPRDGSIGVFVGSTHPMKGFPVVRSLIERLPEVQWVLALRGDLPRGKIPGANVTILRNVLPDRVPLLYRAADFSVCPSLYEPFGYVVAEALACGTPVIAAPGGASRAFLKDPPLDRLLIPDASSVDSFVGAVREVLESAQYYPEKVMELARPRLIELMSPPNWWRRFLGITGLDRIEPAV